MKVKLISNRNAHELTLSDGKGFIKQYLLLYPDGNCIFKAISDDKKIQDTEMGNIKPLFIFFGENKTMMSYIKTKVFIQDNQCLFQTIINGFDEIANGDNFSIKLTENAKDAYIRLCAIASIL